MAFGLMVNYLGAGVLYISSALCIAALAALAAVNATNARHERGSAVRRNGQVKEEPKLGASTNA